MICLLFCRYRFVFDDGLMFQARKTGTQENRKLPGFGLLATEKMNIVTSTSHSPLTNYFLTICHIRKTYILLDKSEVIIGFPTFLKGSDVTLRTLELGKPFLIYTEGTHTLPLRRYVQRR